MASNLISWRKQMSMRREVKDTKGKTSFTQGMSKWVVGRRGKQIVGEGRGYTGTRQDGRTEGAKTLAASSMQFPPCPGPHSLECVLSTLKDPHEHYPIPCLRYWVRYIPCFPCHRHLASLPRTAAINAQLGEPMAFHGHCIPAHSPVGAR